MANKVALLIGVSEYSESNLKPLPSAAEDVQAMQRVLLRSGEFLAEQIQVLTNPQKQEVEEAIYWLFADRQKDDLLLFYFSGHGIKDEVGKLYFSLPATRNDRGRLMKHTAVPATVLHENMNASRSTCQVLVLDCCFSGAFAKGLTIKDDGSVDIPAQLSGKGRAIFTSSNSLEYSFQQDGLNLSVYTHFFVEGLEKGAADLDGDGLISTDELHTYVNDKVKQAAPAMTPQFFPVEQGHKIYLARSAKDDPNLKYRKAVEQRVSSFQVAKNRFLIPVRRALDLLSHQLGVSVEMAEVIEAEVLQPLREYQRKLQEYEQTLRETLEDEGNPLDEVTQLALRDYQTLLGLRDEDVLEIEADILLKSEITVSASTANPLPEPFVIPAEADDLSSGQFEDDGFYTRLRDLLKAEKWQEADQETADRMCEVAGRLEEGWLDYNNIQEFSCLDLKNIDRLWVKYSNGRFGFSVQKRIYLKCGCKPDGSYQNYQLWKRFGDAVGWRVEEEWIYYFVSLIFNTSAPLGHLPVTFLVAAADGYESRRLSSLIQRLIRCSIQ